MESFGYHLKDKRYLVDWKDEVEKVGEEVISKYIYPKKYSDTVYHINNSSLFVRMPTGIFFKGDGNVEVKVFGEVDKDIKRVLKLLEGK